MTPLDLLARIDAGRPPTILDVRSSEEFRRGHVPGALHVPFWAVGSHTTQIPASPDTPIVVYCGHGPRAWMAGSRLRRLGFRRIDYLKGHMHAWRKAGLREER
jgi:rhodanese-related sulfurtransferase